MAKTLHSSNITFVDLTDTKKLDIHISSNLPTTQVYDANTLTHSPDWTSGNKLVLTLTVYADSTDITKDLTDIKWYRQIGGVTKGDPIQEGGTTLTITANELTDASIGGAVGVISYICAVTYNGKAAENQITFSRTNTGKNGTDGADGTSVNIKGTATSVTPVSGTDYYTITYSNSSITLAGAGDAYMYNGDLYVCVGLQAADGKDYFINVGRIQGPTGESAKNIVLSGNAQVFKVSKTNVITPSTITVAGQAINTSISNWTYSTNGGQTFTSTAPAGVVRNGNLVTITGATLGTNSIVIKATNGTIEDSFTVYKAFDGTDGTKGLDGQSASMAFLTNENVTLGANASGQILATSFSTNVVAYNGTTKTTPTIGTISNLPSGMTATIGTAVNNEVPIVFTVANNSTLGSALSNNGSITIPVNGPVYTNLVLSWSKVNSGAQGATGPKGSDAYTVLLTNESHVFAGDVSNAVAGSTTTQVLAYNGTAAQTVTITSVNGKTAAITDTDTGIAGLKFKCSALSGTSPTITFTCTNAFVGPSGSIPIVLSVGGVQITKMFTYSIAFKGATGGTGSVGPAATAYWLMSSASVIHKTSTGTIAVTPATLTFTGKSQTGTNAPVNYACRWVIDASTDGTNYTNLATSTANEASKTVNVATTHKTIRVRMYMAGGTTALLDEQIIPVVTDGIKGSDGASASLVDITPSALYFKSTTGKDGTFTPEYIYLYPRFQTVTFSKWEYSINGGTSWIAASGANGISIGTYNSIGNTLRLARNSTLYTDTITSISFRCVSSNASVYDTVSIVKIYDVVDLQIGGTNMFLDTKNYGGTSPNTSIWNFGNLGTLDGTYLGLNVVKITSQWGRRWQYIPLAKLQVGNTYTMSAWVKNPGGDDSSYKTRIAYFFDNSENGGATYTVLSSNFTRYMYLPTEWTRISVTFRVDTITDSTKNCMFRFEPYTDDSANHLPHMCICGLKFESGNKATDWSPAPEDVDANITKVDTRLTNSMATVQASIDGVTSRVSSTETSITTTNGKVTDLTNRVSTAEQKITPTAIVSTVRQSTDYTNDLSKKVGTSEIISKINQTAETITISANKIGLLGATNIPDLTADKIKGGTLTLGGSNATTQNGQLIVKNSSNVDTLKVNKDGIVVKSGHLAVASDFANQTYNWSTNTWTTTTNTSQLDIGDDYIRMGVYSPSGYTNYMRLLDNGLYFQGNAQGIGSWGSFIGHDSYGDFVIQDTVRGYIVFKGWDDDTELANISESGLSVRGVYSNTTSSASNLHIASNGQFYRSTSSSQRYKTDIKNIQSEDLKPEKLYDLQVKEFKYKEGYLSTEDPRIDTFVPGFIAEEVAEVYPVACEYDGEKPEDWNIRFMVPAMLKLIQDQKKEIDTLKELIGNKEVRE